MKSKFMFVLLFLFGCEDSPMQLESENIDQEIKNTLECRVINTFDGYHLFSYYIDKSNELCFARFSEGIVQINRHDCLQLVKKSCN